MLAGTLVFKIVYSSFRGYREILLVLYFRILGYLSNLLRINLGILFPNTLPRPYSFFPVHLQEQPT